ncbi:MAG: anti-sigma factor [Stenotrophobium sp.]
MKYQNRKLRQMLAAEYVLGTLQGRARARFERLLAGDAWLRDEVHGWEARLGELSKAYTPETPRPLVWASINYRINADAKKVRPIRPAAVAPSSRGPWRAWALLSTAASLALAIGLWQQVQTPPQIETRTVRIEVPVKSPMPYVAILQPAKSQAKWMVSIYPDRHVIKVAAAGRYAVDAQAHSLQLWLLEKSGPRSLGLLPLQGQGELTMPADVQVAGDLTLAVSLEPNGGSRTGKPTGPVLLAAPAIRAL